MKKQIGTILLSSALCLSLIGVAFATSGAVDGQPGQLVYGTDSAGNTVIIELDDQGAIPEDKKDIVGDRPLTDGTNTVKPFTPGSDPTPPPSSEPTGPITPVDPGYYPSTPSTPSSPSYSVTNGSGSSTNGSWSTDKTSAKKGDTVTITVRPNEGYQGTPVVKDANGNNVSVSSLGSNKYSFVMPDGRVTISTEFSPVSVAPANPFTDVRQGDYFYDAVLWAVENGITNGTSATQFSPNQTCTRAQTVTFLWRAAGSPKANSTNNPFTDVTPGAYYYDAVLWAVENGITNGTSATTFSPDNTVTRGQVVTFQYRAAKAQAATGNNPFVDVRTGEYYADAVQWAVNNGITNGTSATTFGPNEGCTRGQIVTFLFRAK